MLAPKFSISVLKNSSFTILSPSINSAPKSLLKALRFAFSDNNDKSQNMKSSTQLITYVPIRPLKKYLTPLYVQKNYLNKGKITKRVPFWPYLTPFYAILINNFLTSWSFINTSIASVLLVAGVILRQSPNRRRQREIIKFECNQDMSKLYMTVPYSITARYISTTFPHNYKGFQDWNVFTEEQLKNKEYVPSQADKRTFSEEELREKKEAFDRTLVEKILKEKKLQTTINRFELDTEKTLFKLSNNYLDAIKDHQVLHPEIQIRTEQMLNIPYKYLIVRTQFTHKKSNKPFHFFIDLEENGDLKYQDYLTAMGANYKISLASEMK